MRKLLIFLLLTSCGSLHQDTAPSAIDVGQKRVETIICDNHEVGENGCVFTDGIVTSNLKIYKVNTGSVEIIGCGIDQNTNYNNVGEWLEIKLPSSINEDCVITITQRVTWKGSDRVKFPIEAAIGTVTIGTCHGNTHCSMEFEQRSLSQAIKPIMLDGEGSGVLALSGCGKTLIPPTEFMGSISLPLAKYLPNTKGTGCMFIMGVKGEQLHKLYKKVWRYDDTATAVKSPALTDKGKKLCYQGDAQSLASSVNGKISIGPNGCFTPNQAGDYVRFYTSQGRSLITFIKNKEIVWIK